jgi:subtilisin family serine protease
MGRPLFTYLLFFLFAGKAALAAASEDEAREWILTRTPSKASWSKLLSSNPELEFINSFGPFNKYAKVRAKSKIKSQLAKEIVALQRNLPYQAFEQTDPSLGQSWGLVNHGQTIPNLGAGKEGVDVGAAKSWELATGNKNVVIAVLDSGIDLKHEDLRQNLWFNKLELETNSLDDDHNGFVNDLNGWNFVDDNATVQDDNNHGSAVSGVIAADAKNGKGSRGVLANTSLMVVKMLDENGAGTTDRAVKGIEYAVSNGASVINASWGGTVFDQVLFDTIQWANTQGVVVVCAAGNEAKDNDTDDKPSYPASFNLPNVMSVAAIDNKGQLANFSNYGKETVHLAAPGVGIYTTVRGGYQYLDGTSFAAPFVTSVAALLKGQEPSLAPKEIKDRLIKTVVALDYYMKERMVSGGRVHSYNALKNIISPKPQTPSGWLKVVKTMETSHPYLSDTKQVFEVAQPGATHVRVHFTRFELEKKYDFILIKDKEGRLVISYSGKMGDFWSADVLGDTLRIEFISDFSSQDWGFSIDAFEYTL